MCLLSAQLKFLGSAPILCLTLRPARPMAKKQRQKESAKAKATNVQPEAHVSTVPSPPPQSSPASKHTSMTPRGVTPRPPSTRHTSPKSIQRPFQEEEQEAGKWQDQSKSDLAMYKYPAAVVFISCCLLRPRLIATIHGVSDYIHSAAAS